MYLFIGVASSDTTARLWSMSTGAEIKVYQGHHKATVCCALHDGAESSAAWIWNCVYGHLCLCQWGCLYILPISFDISERF